MNKTEVKFIFAYFKGRWVRLALLPKTHNESEYTIEPNQEVDQSLKPSSGRNCKEAYEYIISNAKEMIFPERLSDKDLKELCYRNDIPLNWVTNRFVNGIKESSGGRKQQFKTKRKCPPISSKDYNIFIDELNKINKTAGLIAEILYFINKSFGGYTYITLEEILRLKTSGVDFDDKFSKCISTLRLTSKESHLVSHYLPDKLWDELKNQIRPDSIYIFSNKNRGPLLAGDIDRLFKKAGKNAGIKEAISSLSLRPVCISYLIDPLSSNFEEISVEEWDGLCRTIPTLVMRRGRHSKHDPRDIMNMILHRLKEKKLVRDFPAYVDSQYRRWKKTGVFDAVIASRQ